MVILITCRQIRLRHSPLQLAPEPSLESKQAPAPAMRRRSLPGVRSPFIATSASHPPSPLRCSNPTWLRWEAHPSFRPSSAAPAPSRSLPQSSSPFLIPPHHHHSYSQADSITWFLRTGAFAGVHLWPHPPRGNHGRLLGFLSYATLLSSPPRPLNNNSNNNNKA